MLGGAVRLVQTREMWAFTFQWSSRSHRQRKERKEAGREWMSLTLLEGKVKASCNFLPSSERNLHCRLYLVYSQSSLEKQNQQDTHRQRDWWSWLLLFWVLDSLLGPASRLETQAILLCSSLTAEFLLLWETRIFALQDLKLLDKICIHYRGNSLYLKSTDYKF